MPVPLLAQLFCCCTRPRRLLSPPDTPVIPNERSRLIDSPPPSPAIVVDHQKLSDRLGTIVRAKEGKMVSVSSRTPFTMYEHDTHDEGSDDASLPAPPEMPAPPPQPTVNANLTVSRRPPVLTMTPARPQLPFDRTDAGSTSSRSSSRIHYTASPRSQHAPQSTSRSTSSVPGSSRAALSPPALPTSEWLGESASESELSASIEETEEDEKMRPPSPAASTPGAGVHAAQSTPVSHSASIATPALPSHPQSHTQPDPQPPGDAGDIAFDWDDT